MTDASTTTAEGATNPATAMTKDDLAAREGDVLRDAALEPSLPEDLRALRNHVAGALGDDLLDTLGFRGELTLVVRPERVADALRLCRDDPDLACELLADLSGVHWPGGAQTVNAEETTGWPSYIEDAGAGRVEVDYLVRSVTHGHAFRLRASVPDDAPELPSATAVYGSANVMEREVWDFFGVRFTGHPNLVRILMPDDWEGHPQRKDYPLGGVEIDFQGTTIPPPDERDY